MVTTVETYVCYCNSPDIIDFETEKSRCRYVAEEIEYKVAVHDAPSEAIKDRLLSKCHTTCRWVTAPAITTPICNTSCHVVCSSEVDGHMFKVVSKVAKCPARGDLGTPCCGRKIHPVRHCFGPYLRD